MTWTVARQLHSRDERGNEEGEKNAPQKRRPQNSALSTTFLLRVGGPAVEKTGQKRWEKLEKKFCVATRTHGPQVPANSITLSEK